MSQLSKKNPIWGKGVYLLYGSFVFFILAMVLFSSMQDFHLVEDNYYQKEINYQSMIEKNENYLSLAQKPVWMINHQEKVIILKFPEPFVNDEVTGEIIFFRPSDKAKDINVNLDIDQSGLQIISTENFIKGKWKIKVNWQADDKRYYFEDIFFIE
ncbi:FixH family protein [Candidatus Zixiibacteriota bacterium]